MNPVSLKKSEFPTKQAAVNAVRKSMAAAAEAAADGAAVSRIVHVGPSAKTAFGWRGDDGARIDSETRRTVGAEAAAIDECVSIVAESESIDAGTVTYSVRVRIGSGSARTHHKGRVPLAGSAWGTYAATVSGDLVDYAAVKREAFDAAAAAARGARTAARASARVIGTCEPSASVPIDAAAYAALRSYVTRRAYGNAGATANGRTQSEYVRAGTQASGAGRVDVHAVDDATQAAVLIVARWAADGLPEAMAARVDAIETPEGRRALVLGSAARDGLRIVTEGKRMAARADAQRASKYGAAIAADPSADAGTFRTPETVTARIVQVSLTRGKPSLTMAETHGGAPMARGAGSGSHSESTVGGTSYVNAARIGDSFTGACLSIDATGRLRFPALAALVLSGSADRPESIAAAARILLGSDSQADRRAVRAMAAAQYPNAVGMAATVSGNDAADAPLGAMAYVR